MTTFIPPYMGEEIKSNAEKKMFDVLSGLEMKDCVVLHSLGLPRHRSKIYGEIDFVVVCERGVACLEIKGGRVECREGKWYFTDRYGTEREKPEGPFAQVTGNMFSLREVLKSRFQNNPHLKNLLVACGVVFPDIAFRSVSQEIIPEIVYDSGTSDITVYINGVFDYWQGRQRREPDKLPPATVTEIVGYLRGEFVFLPTLSHRLDSVEQRLVRLTGEQVRIMEALSANPRLLVEGSAGTGKTLLATHFACGEAAAGKRVLYLTFNKNLASHIARQVEQQSQPDKLKIINLHALFGEYVTVDAGEMKENPHLYFSEILPERFYDYIAGLPEETAEGLRYDLIVMDEGQDIIKPLYLYSLDALLKGGFSEGRWAVFYDEKQNIYNPEYAEGLEILQGYPCTQFRLFVNCRNTVQIGAYGSQVSGLELGEFIKENGEEVQKVRYADAADFKKQIKDILKYLRSEKVEWKDVVFLAPKRYGNSLLAEAGIEVNELGEDFDPAKDLPVYATIQGFKGLDAKVVIIVDAERIRKEDFSKFLYIAVSRARTLLYVVAAEEFWTRA